MPNNFRVKLKLDKEFEMYKTIVSFRLGLKELSSVLELEPFEELAFGHTFVVKINICVT